jgi:hypothetical protein
LLADGIGCCNRMVVRRAAPSSLRMIIRSIVEAARDLDNGANQARVYESTEFAWLGALHFLCRLNCNEDFQWR